MKKLLLGSLFSLAFCQIGISQDFTSAIKSYLADRGGEHQMRSDDVSDIQVSSQSFSKSLNAYNVYADQKYKGIPIYNSSSSFVVRNNQVRSAKMAFVSSVAGKANSSTPAFSAVSAISKAVSKLGLPTPSNLRLLENNNQYSYIFNNGDVFLENIPVELVYQPIEDGNKLILAWSLGFYLNDASHYYSVRLDAQTGDVLAVDDKVISCGIAEDHSHIPTESVLAGFRSSAPSMTIANANEPKYRVFPMPLSSPTEGEDQLITDPSDPIASPFGWHDTDGLPGHEYTITRGNNVYAYEDKADRDRPGESADGGENMLFDFAYDLPRDPHDFTEAAVTNLFYFNNIMHDVFYQYGFDEPSGNFQQNNYDRGGTQGDGVMAEAQDGQRMNNANFYTPNDGGTPRMQMFLWTAPGRVLGTYLTLNDGALSGKYFAEKARFGPGVTTEGVTAQLVLAQNEGSEDPHDACTDITNASDLAGKIAVIRKGTCGYTTKVLKAQDAGAIGVVIVNDAQGDPIAMTGSGNITIPAIMIYQNDGEAIIESLLAGNTINSTLMDDGSGTDNIRRDGDLDNHIIAHEYGHGISNRLTGGRFNSTCLFNEEQMGEGWSDYFGLMLLMKPGDKATDVRGVGTYVLGQGREGIGIRQRPYTTDMSINPFTYKNIKNQAAPHGVGSVWATMLWDMTWAFIDEYGYDEDIYYGTGGNNMALQLVMDGLKLQKCSPGFVDGRDAILEADQLANEGANQCLIWHSFARRGLGLSANQGSSYSKSDGTEAFDVPEECILGVGKNDSIKNKFIVYPNPSHGEIHIQTRFDITDATVSIYDMNGRKVLREEIFLEGEQIINTSSLAPGLYMVNVEGGGVSQTVKLIVE